MKSFQAHWAALAAAMVLAACGGGDSGSDPGLGQLVAFGDSYSDVGSYGVGSVALIGAQTGGAGR